MKNHHFEATGVLVLDKVTPIILALFGAFNLHPFYPGGGRAYIAKQSVRSDPQWRDVLVSLVGPAGKRGLPIPDAPAPRMGAVLQALSAHFCADRDEALRNLIKHYDFDGPVDLEAAFTIATRLDDGHGLVELQFEGCWHCDTPRLGEFGGVGRFFSREVRLVTGSTRALDLGARLRKAIREDDLEGAAARIVQESRRLFGGISDASVRMRLVRLVASRFLAGVGRSLTSTPDGTPAPPLFDRFAALLQEAVVPGGIGAHEFDRPGGWRERAQRALDAYQAWKSSISA